MSQPDDKPLHDWVRQSLANYRPSIEPTDWKRMQRQLRRPRRLRWGMLISLGLLLSTASWWMTRPSGNHPRSVNQVLRKPPTLPFSTDTTDRVNDQHLMVMKTPPVIRLESSAQPNPPIKPEFAKKVVALSPSLVLKPLSAKLVDLSSRVNQVRFSVEEAAIIEQVQTGQFGFDSTSYRAVERNLARWPDAVIVCDLTSSMYPYTTQLISWLRKRAGRADVAGLVFFTDCDSLGRPTRPGGPAGQMYFTRSLTPALILPKLVAAARNTVGNEDDAENDVEALAFAQRTFAQAKHLILIADNLSRVKDMALLSTLSKPVHVILCGTTGGDLSQAFQPEFGRIAAQTKGSLHTLEDDVNPWAVSAGQTLRAGPYYYRYSSRRNQFVLTSFQHRPRRFLGFIWL